MFPAVTFTPVQLLLVCVAALLGALLASRWFRKDEAKEDRDVERIGVCGLLTEMKLPRLSEIMARVVARDLSGFLRECILLRKEAAKGKPAIMAMLYENFFEYQLPARMENPEDRAKIIEMVDDLNIVTESKAQTDKEKVVASIRAAGGTVTLPSEAK